ncbi:hypothetical protein ACIBF6_35325 [Streptosporangium amethystogenes]|uniref:hypothetical protein n=1 Tax=Streptosporangium amethystogenes TaxID=2002 RepID=UPI0037A2C2BB
MSVDQEQTTYTDEHRRRDLDLLREIMGGEPDPEMLQLDRQRDQEFTARRSHAA